MDGIIGAQLDNYRIVEKLGEGGMGSVYRAVDVMLERDVALKFLRPELSREPELVQRFRAEAVLLAKLNHHFIAPIFGLHRYREELFIAMEYVPGETLDARLKRIERFSPDAAMHITSMVLQALDYAHRLGVVHRDIKPGNVILTPAGTAKVMDFGIARVIGAERRTRVGSIVGTIAYMAPEQIQGKDADQRADLYSVGTLLYEMLSGHVPFRADTDWAMMQAQIGLPPQPLRSEVDVPEVLEAAVLRSLEKTPDRRYQSAAEFQRALEEVAREGGDVSAFLEIEPSRRDSGTGTQHLRGGPPGAHWQETRLGVPTPSQGSSAGASVPPPERHVSVPSTDLTRLAPTPPPPGSSSSGQRSDPGLTVHLGHGSSGGIAPSYPPPPASSPGQSPYPWAAPPVAAQPPEPVPAPPSAPPPAVGQPLVGASVSAAKPASAAANKAGATKKSAVGTGVLVGALVALVALAGIGVVVWQRMQQPAEVATPLPAAGEQAAVTPGFDPNASPGSVAPGEPGIPGQTGTPAAGVAAGTPAPGTTPPGTVPPGTVPPGTPAATKNKPAPGTPDATGSTAAAKAGTPATPAPAPVAGPEPIPSPAAPFERPPTAAAPDPPAPAVDGGRTTPGPVFKDLKIIREKGPEVDAELHFGASQLDVTNSGGRTKFHALTYASIGSAEYQEQRQMRVIVRTTRYWLVLKGTTGWELRLRLERENAKQIVDALEQHWGRKVTTVEAEQERP